MAELRDTGNTPLTEHGAGKSSKHESPCARPVSGSTMRFGREEPEDIRALRALRDELCASVWGWTSVEHDGEEFVSEADLLAATDRIYALSDALDAAVNLLTGEPNPAGATIEGRTNPPGRVSGSVS